MIGQELGGRYEIIARIGGGGMALVYKAHDILLNRNVAIKVLRQQYVHDEDFIRRFRREAQSAASLSHPNVVSIYDVGQQGEIHYIVMEYVEGINLNEKIAEKAPLQVEDAVHIASQICDALEHAHHNGIIHRDIKPHNILIGKNGRVKVTDFGIARAATASDITQTGSVIGSVHYFSPEHAKGVSQGEKSDLYSLGIVLYQMLTGRLPFLGESPISVALKHLQEEMEEPRKVNPLIPQSMENVILKAVRKRPEERYQSAKEMLADLDKCLLPENRNAPKVMFTDADVYFDDSEKTRVMPAIKEEQLNGNPKKDRDESSPSWSGLEEKQTRKMSWIKPAVWAVVIIGLLLLMWYGVSYVKNLLEIPEVEVPMVIDLTLEDAVAKLEANHLKADPIDRKSNEVVAKDIVIDQDKVGMKVNEGSSIRLIVSDGPETLKMPKVVGKSWQDAEVELLTKFSKDQIKKKDIFSDESAGTVLKQSPEADEVYDPEEVNVIITVSKGTGTVEIPNLIGSKEDVAKSILTQKNLKFEVMPVETYTPKGIVFKQFPMPGDLVEQETQIIVYVSSGYPPDTLEVTKDLEVSPTESGQKTKIKIVVSDARWDNNTWGESEITETMTYPIPLVLSKDKNAVISIYKNDQLSDTKTVTYMDALNGNVNDAPTGAANASNEDTAPAPDETGEQQEVPADSE